MKRTASVTMGLPQLDIHTIKEDWAAAAALEQIWLLLAESLGLSPSEWIDSQGDRMYGAVMYMETWFDLADPLREDDAVTLETEFLAVRKPHAWAEVRFVAGGTCKARVRILTSFIKRQVKGSNKKFSKVRDLWTAEDQNGELVDQILDRHHKAKSESHETAEILRYEINRIQDFNTADFMYFKNFVRICKAGEWKQNRGEATRLNQDRQCFYFGNVSDGDEISVRIRREGEALVSELVSAEGNRLFLSLATAPVVEIAQR